MTGHAKEHPTAVLKFGGDVVADAERLHAVLAEVAELTASGWRFALCHGGGPQANALQKRLGLEPVKVGGRRVTDDATLQVMKHVLAGEVSVDVVAAATAAGLRAVGISGVSAGLVTAHRRPPKVVSGGGPDPVDFGFVGDVTEIRPELVHHLWTGGYTPVINTLGIADETERAQSARSGGMTAQVYNINADTIASALAAAIRADHLFLMTGVPGVLRDKDDPSTRIPHLNEAAAREAIASGVIVGGMIPKVEEALDHLAAGIGAVHILGAQAGSLREEAAAPGSTGTVLTHA
jgi:acetylglutamate kinase